MKFYTALLVIVAMISCSKRTDRVEPDIEKQYTLDDDFFPEYKGGAIKHDTIYLSVVIDDCGEWGGPRDEFKMYVDLSDEYRLNFKRFRFKCDSIGYYNSLDKLPLDRQEDLVLSARQKNILSNFYMLLMKAKMKECVNSNAGSLFSLRSNDSTLNIQVYSNKAEVKNDYINFKRALDL
jgi:hypothetical protein